MITYHIIINYKYFILGCKNMEEAYKMDDHVRIVCKDTFCSLTCKRGVEIPQISKVVCKNARRNKDRVKSKSTLCKKSKRFFFLWPDLSGVQSRQKLEQSDVGCQNIKRNAARLRNIFASNIKAASKFCVKTTNVKLNVLRESSIRCQILAVKLYVEIQGKIL